MYVFGGASVSLKLGSFAIAFLVMFGFKVVSSFADGQVARHHFSRP